MSDSIRRQCKDCLETFDISNFFKTKVIADKTYYRHTCCTCHAKKTTQRRHQIRHSYVEWKKGLRCQECGFSDHRALHFHHHDRNKEANISDMVQNGFALENIKKEAAKCTVLCANCHAIAHAA